MLLDTGLMLYDIADLKVILAGHLVTHLILKTPFSTVNVDVNSHGPITGIKWCPEEKFLLILTKKSVLIYILSSAALLCTYLDSLATLYSLKTISIIPNIRVFTDSFKISASIEPLVMAKTRNFVCDLLFRFPASDLSAGNRE